MVEPWVGIHMIVQMGAKIKVTPRTPEIDLEALTLALEG